MKVGFFTTNDVNTLMTAANAAKLALGLPQSTSTLWQYPNDAKAVRKQEPPRPYKGRGLPEGVVSVFTTYREPGLRVPRPEGHGYWRFDDVAKLYYKDKLFAVVGTATGLSQNGHARGYVTAVVIYDEDGDGKLERVENINDDKGGPYSFHLPKWLTP